MRGWLRGVVSGKVPKQERGRQDCGEVGVVEPVDKVRSCEVLQLWGCTCTAIRGNVWVWDANRRRPARTPPLRLTPEAMAVCPKRVYSLQGVKESKRSNIPSFVKPVP